MGIKLYHDFANELFVCVFMENIVKKLRFHTEKNMEQNAEK